MNNDLISVIVPVYKVEQYLDECVSSIVNQTYKNLEIILVDDGSPDSCGKMCDNWAKKDTRITVIHKENGGLSDARNAGLDIFKGEYVAFVDSDDYVESNYIETLYTNIKDADMCLCNITAFSENNQKKAVVEKGIVDSDKFFEMMFSPETSQYSVVAWNKLYRRNLWDNVRYPFRKIHEDRYVSCDIISQCSKIVCLEDYLYWYRYHEGSISTIRNIAGEFDDINAFWLQIDFFKQNSKEKLLRLAANNLYVFSYELGIYMKNNNKADKNSLGFVANTINKLEKDYGITPENVTNYHKKVSKTFIFMMKKMPVIIILQEKILHFRKKVMNRIKRFKNS